MNFLDLNIPAQEDSRVWSPLQAEIFSACAGGDQNLLIDAVAGSGKTTTILEAANHLSGRPIFLAFGRENAEDIRRKAPSGLKVMTLNGLGYLLCMQNAPWVKLEKAKLKILLEQQVGNASIWWAEYSYPVRQIVSLAKGMGLGLAGMGEASPQAMEDIILSFGLEIPPPLVGEAALVAARLFENSIKQQNVIDFDDQIYFPLLLGWPFPSYNAVIVDETQDLNDLQHLVLQHLAIAGARLLAVGDPFQSIYGFRGALSNSMELLQNKFQMRKLPLSVTYRCPLAVVREAQRYVPHMTARPGAPEGEVRDIYSSGPNKDPEDFGDALVLCRNNAPMFKSILKYLRAKRPCQVRTNFIEGFVGWIRGFKCDTTLEVIPRLDLWKEKELEAAKKRNSFSMAQRAQDRWETAVMLCREHKRTLDVIRMVEALAKSATGTQFSTIHRAKGLEHDRVYLLRPDLFGLFARTKEQIQQEDNLAYVAITRAKSSFTYGASEE